MRDKNHLQNTLPWLIGVPISIIIINILSL